MLKKNKAQEIAKALCIVLVFVLSFWFLKTTVRAAMIEPIYKVLQSHETAGTMGYKIHEIWSVILNVSNSFVIILLIGVAFAQILRININTYGIKKTLPSLVLAIIAANFSFLFCRLIVDFANVIISLFIGGSNSGGSGEVIDAFTKISDGLSIKMNPCTGGSDDTPGVNCYTWGTLFWHSFATLMTFAGAIVVAILAFLFLIRIYLIYFLVPLAPLAFMSLAIPYGQAKSLFSQWWSNFAKWTFMPVISVFWIWLGAQWFSLIGSSGTIVSFFFAGICFYLAITTPFKMGGAVMAAWGNVGKKAWGKTGGQAVGGAKEGMSQYYDRQKGYVKNKFWDTKMGKSIKERQYDSRVRNELPGLVAAKREKDNRNKAMYRMWQKHNDPSNKFNLGVAASRVKAELRSAEGDEASTTYGAINPQGAYSELNNMGALDNSGKLKSEEELLRLGYEKYIAIHGLYKRIAILRNNSATKDEAMRLFGGEYKDGNGQIQTSPGIFIDANEANNAFARDFAGGIRDSDNQASATNAGPSPVAGSSSVASSRSRAAVGPLHVILDDVKQNAENKLKDVQKEAAKIIGTSATNQLINTANHYKTSFEDFIKNSNINWNEMEEGAKAIVRHAFDGLRNSKEVLLQEAIAAGDKQVEEKMIGIRGAYKSLQGGVKIPALRDKITNAQKLLKNGKLEEAGKIVSEISGTMVFGGRKEDMQKAINTRLTNLSEGTKFFEDKINKIASIKDEKEKYSALETTRLSMQNEKEFYKTTESELRAKATREATITVASKVALNQTVAKPELAGMNISQYVGSKHFESTVNELTSAVRGLRQSSGVSSIDKNELQAIRNAMKDALTGGINTVMQNPANQNISAQQALSDETLRRAIHMGVDQAARETKSKVKTTNPSSSTERKTLKPNK